MVTYTTMLLILVGVVTVPVIAAMLFWYLSYNRTAWIAKQTGKEANDVVWVRDKFKVRMINGVYTLIFRNQVERAPSFSGHLWAKIYHKQIKYTPERWATLDMSKKIQRGLFLYQDEEGHYIPLTIRVDGKNRELFGLPQNMRMFTAQSIAENQKLTLNARQLFKMNLAAIIGVVILGLAFLFFVIYTTKVQAETAISCTQIFQNATQSNGFITGLAQGVVGG